MSDAEFVGRGITFGPTLREILIGGSAILILCGMLLMLAHGLHQQEEKSRVAKEKACTALGGNTVKYKSTPLCLKDSEILEVLP